MFNYFKELFTKPKYLWTSLDDLALAGLVIGILIIIFGIWILCYYICGVIAEKKQSKCVNRKLDGFDSYKCQKKQCMFCKDYKSKGDDEK